MTERRQITRQSCELPLHIIQVGSEPTDWLEQTVNISSNGGLCFLSCHSLALGEEVRYILTVSQAGPTEVRLSCSGVAVRSRPVNSGSQELFENAVTMRRYRFEGRDKAERSAGFVPEKIPALAVQLTQAAG
jgi:hypothetical protein